MGHSLGQVPTPYGVGNSVELQSVNKLVIVNNQKKKIVISFCFFRFLIIFFIGSYRPLCTGVATTVLLLIEEKILASKNIVVQQHDINSVFFSYSLLSLSSKYIRIILEVKLIPNRPLRPLMCLKLSAHEESLLLLE